MTPKLTEQGYALMMEALSGTGIVFTRVAVGNGDVPVAYRELTSLQNETASMEIQHITKERQYVRLDSTMSNSLFDGEFRWTEFGVFAQDPDGGEDILYAYGHYILDGDDKPITIPPAQTNLIEISHQVYVFVGELDNVNAILSQHPEFASHDDLNRHISDNENPHAVTKEQLGLGNVPNAAPHNMVPVFSNAASSYTHNSGTGKLVFPNIFSGETFGAMLRKIRTFISLMTDHVNQKNPHRLAARDIEAAEKNHAHSAYDINSGVLSLRRGGTGGESAAEARYNMGIFCGQFTATIIAGKPLVHEHTYTKPVQGGFVPMVVASPLLGTSKALEIGIQSMSSTGFKVYIYSPSFSGDVSVNWIACSK